VYAWEWQDSFSFGKLSLKEEEDDQYLDFLIQLILSQLLNGTLKT
jgi:hypothetical protein